MDSKQFYQILSAIKRCFSRGPQHKAARAKALCPRKKGPRGGARYRCAKCKKDYSSHSVQVDHIDPIVPIGVAGHELSWDILVDRIFCEQDNLQVLCESCHADKSKAENEARQQARKDAQE